MHKGIRFTSNKEISCVLAFWALIAALVVCLALIPAERIGFGHNLCVFKAITHRPCPGCGMSRAFAACLQGDIHKAIGYNRLIIVVFPLMAYILLKKLSRDLHRIFRLTRPKLAQDQALSANRQAELR